MSKYIPYVLGVLIGLLVVVSIAAASALDSDKAEPETFEAAGRTCVFYKGQLDCLCPCSTDPCSATGASTISGTRVVTVPQVITVTVVERSGSGVTIPPEDGSDPTEPVEDDDTTIRVPVTSEGPDPERDKERVINGERCNQGVGNGPEGCSPGRSDNTVNPDHPHDPNDEGPDTGPGSPGRQGGTGGRQGDNQGENKGKNK